jgi:hypothetical protein
VAAFRGEVELTLRGITLTVPFDIAYIGKWKTPWRDGDVEAILLEDLERTGAIEYCMQASQAG